MTKKMLGIAVIIDRTAVKLKADAKENNYLKVIENDITPVFENRSLVMANVSLRSDQIGTDLKTCMEKFKDDGIEEVMAIIAGNLEGVNFHRPVEFKELQGALQGYAMLRKMEEHLEKMGDESLPTSEES